MKNEKRSDQYGAFDAYECFGILLKQECGAKFSVLKKNVCKNLDAGPFQNLQSHDTSFPTTNLETQNYFRLVSISEC